MATIDNSSVITFSTPTGQWQQPTHYAIHSARTGWDPLATDVLASRPSRPQSGDAVEIAAAALSISVTASGGFTDALIRIFLVSLAFDLDYVSLHTASPTAGNELTSGSSPGYTRATVGTVA